MAEFQNPGTGLPWGPWGRPHTELSKSWESSRRQWAWWGMVGFQHSPHTYHLHMVPLGILKQMSAGLQRRSEPEAQAAQRVGVLSGNAENHPEEGDMVRHLGGGREPASPTPTTSSLVKGDEPSWLRAIQSHRPPAPFLPLHSQSTSESCPVHSLNVPGPFHGTPVLVPTSPVSPWAALLPPNQPGFSNFSCMVGWRGSFFF